MVLKSGQILTEEMAEAMAIEFESDDFDFSGWIPQPIIGRPSLGAGLSPRVTFRASPKLYEALRDCAQKEGRSVSEIARDAMERYVTSRKH